MTNDPPDPFHSQPTERGIWQIVSANSHEISGLDIATHLSRVSGSGIVTPLLAQQVKNWLLEANRNDLILLRNELSLEAIKQMEISRQIAYMHIRPTDKFFEEFRRRYG